MEVLNQGPLHEAFAELHAEDVEPGFLVPREPPPPITEVPPEYDGEGAIWIPGYWGWDDEREDFVWISGVWRRTPPGREWIGGSWQETDAGWQWVSGYWIDGEARETEYLPIPPESLEAGPSSIAPQEGQFYVPGCWTYLEDTYRWRPGYWSPAYDNWVWVPDRYVWTPRGCIYRRGYWDFPPVRRGSLYAPIYFRAHARIAGYRYRPHFAIDLGPAFFANLFVRPTYGHYYFGNYYDIRYRSRNIYPWVNIWTSYRRYDPLFAYYHYRGGRHRQFVNGVRQWHHYFDRHHEHRPARTLAAQRHRHFSGNIDRMTRLAVDADVLRGRQERHGGGGRGRPDLVREGARDRDQRGRTEGRDGRRGGADREVAVPGSGRPRLRLGDGDRDRVPRSDRTARPDNIARERAERAERIRRMARGEENVDRLRTRPPGPGRDVGEARDQVGRGSADRNRRNRTPAEAQVDARDRLRSTAPGSSRNAGGTPSNSDGRVVRGNRSSGDLGDRARRGSGSSAAESMRSRAPGPRQTPTDARAILRQRQEAREAQARAARGRQQAIERMRTPPTTQTPSSNSTRSQSQERLRAQQQRAQQQRAQEQRAQQQRAQQQRAQQQRAQQQRAQRLRTPPTAQIPSRNSTRSQSQERLRALQAQQQRAQQQRNAARARSSQPRRVPSRSTPNAMRSRSPVPNVTRSRPAQPTTRMRTPTRTTPRPSVSRSPGAQARARVRAQSPRPSAARPQVRRAPVSRGPVGRPGPSRARDISRGRAGRGN